MILANHISRFPTTFYLAVFMGEVSGNWERPIEQPPKICRNDPKNCFQDVKTMIFTSYFKVAHAVQLFFLKISFEVAIVG
jgi:hypothetical protein